MAKSNSLTGKLIVLCGIVLVCFGAQAGVCQSNDEATLADCFSKNTIIANTLEGEINTYIVDQIEPCQFVLVGEQHGIEEPSHITQLIFRNATPAGFKYLCIETDPVVGQFIYRSAKMDSLEESFLHSKSLYKEYPQAIPFYENAKDCKLFRQVCRLPNSNSDCNIWGIDQTFVLGWGLAFSYLLERCENDSDRELLKSLIEKSRLGQNKATSTGDLRAFMSLQYDIELHKRLVEIFDDEGSQQFLQSLHNSKRIDEASFLNRKRYESVRLRATNMVNNFIYFYKRAKKTDSLPKVVFKLGYDHVGRGQNGSGVFDIGNHASELARHNGLGSFHIQVLGINGFESHNGLFSRASKISRFDQRDELPRELQQFLSRQKSTDKYTVINLKPFRHLSVDVSKEFTSMLHRFDTVVLVQDCVAIKGFSKD